MTGKRYKGKTQRESTPAGTGTLPASMREKTITRKEKQAREVTL